MPVTKREHQSAEGRVEKAVDRVLTEELPKSAAGNAIYWVGVVAGAFVLNLLLLVIFARA